MQSGLMSVVAKRSPPSPCGRGLGGGGEPHRVLGFARAMRREPTAAETLLRLGLRNHQVGGLTPGLDPGVRRQAPIGPFIADFFCASARLVVEVDGITHAESSTDAGRDAWMRKQGLRVLRFWHDDVMTNLEGVVGTIRVVACDPLPLAPSRKGRGDSLEDV